MKKTFVLLIIGIFVLCTFWFYQLYTSSLSYSLNPDSENRVVVKIEKGSSANKIINILKEKDLIKSPFIFKLYLKQNNLGNQLKAGNFILKENYNLKKIVKTLVEGKGSELPVTILEGWTIKQIAEHLEKKGLTKSSEFLSCIKTCKFEFDFLPKGYLEGYLYPDTYFVNINNFNNKLFISRMIQTLEHRLSDSDWKAIKSSKYSFEQIMIMASIIEKEERNAKEQPKVADILWSRFDKKVALGADATVLYALGRTKGGLTYNDLQIDSPYNTRKKRGLPPTPISSPSMSSIKAAIYPKKTDYFYYLHGSDGKIHYAKTLAGHNENKMKYINN